MFDVRQNMSEKACCGEPWVDVWTYEMKEGEPYALLICQGCGAPQPDVRIEHLWDDLELMRQTLGEYLAREESTILQNE